MAQLSASTSFVEEINYNEIEILEVVGKGSFGVVNKGKWRDKFVAVKMISSESEKKAFIVEVRQLSRVNHPNIVRLYGACTNKPVCLVMEYAEGGSLYNVLHGNPQPEYTASHAISWALQCAKGVAYLHNMKPKALIHRDLKPPNLLLIMAGTVLKICDFGTACDMHTHMTNNKGSAAWMAPEVFEGSNYSEKCDVFSWGIILWEVITRRKPFDDSGSAYRILWAVHSGKRPPLIKNCPKPLEILMTRCWAEKPSCRPSMDEVVNIMSHMFSFFKGADEPIKYPPPSAVQLLDDDSDDSDYSDEGLCESEFSNPPMAASTVDSSGSDRSSRFTTNIKENSATLSELNIITGPSSLSSALQSRISMTSAPASLAGSKEDVRGELESTLAGGEIKITEKRISPKSVRAQGHQRSGSYGSNFVVQPNPMLLPEPILEKNANKDLIAKSIGILTTSNLPLGEGGDSSSHRVTSNERKQSWPQHKVPTFQEQQQQSVQPSPETIDNAYLLLDTRLQPLTPYNKSWESMQLFEEHKKLAYEYIRTQTEIALLRQRKVELAHLLEGNTVDVCDIQQNGSVIMNEYDKLTKEKENLKQLHQNLNQQLALTRNQKDQS